MLTNYHVVEGPGHLVVMSPDGKQQIPAKVLAQDKERDIALLQVESELLADVAVLDLAQGQIGRGKPVAAFGYPLGTDFGAGLKLTTGVVSALPEAVNDDLILLDCRVNPGNSGGPLCDKHGKVVGMVTAKSLASERVDSYGMALPAETLVDFLTTNLPGYSYTEPASSSDQLEWDQVDRQVSPSVLMVMKVSRKPASPQGAQTEPANP